MPRQRKYPSHAGAGGYWTVRHEVLDSTVIAQQGTHHCCAAAIQMVLAARGIKANQLEVATEIGTPTLIGKLAPELKKRDPSRIWVRGIFEPASLPFLHRRAPWIALMKDYGTPDLHAVVVDGTNGNGDLLIRDPWPPGTSYIMTSENFWHERHGWSGFAIYVKQRRPTRRKTRKAS